MFAHYIGVTYMLLYTNSGTCDKGVTKVCHFPKMCRFYMIWLQYLGMTTLASSSNYYSTACINLSFLLLFYIFVLVVYFSYFLITLSLIIIGPSFCHILAPIILQFCTAESMDSVMSAFLHLCTFHILYSMIELSALL